jgi:hypothetical protein
VPCEASTGGGVNHSSDNAGASSNGAVAGRPLEGAGVGGGLEGGGAETPIEGIGTGDPLEGTGTDVVGAMVKLAGARSVLSGWVPAVTTGAFVVLADACADDPLDVVDVPVVKGKDGPFTDWAPFAPG